MTAMHSALLLLVVAALAGGCVERKMVITSEPTGAVITVNQTWRGTTPMDLPFKHYGTYDIRLEKAGYYPMQVAEPVVAPLYGQPGVDFAAEVLYPGTARDTRKLHYRLEKIDAPDKLTDILERSGEMRTRTKEISEAREAQDAKRKPKSLPLPIRKEVKQRNQQQAKGGATEKTGPEATDAGGTEGDVSTRAESTAKPEGPELE